MSLRREFAGFVAGLRYENLPPEVDRAKGVTLRALSSALIAHNMPASRQALALMQEEEGGAGGAATALCHGTKLTKAGAAFVNAETIFAGRQVDMPAEKRERERMRHILTGLSCLATYGGCRLRYDHRGNRAKRCRLDGAARRDMFSHSGGSNSRPGRRHAGQRPDR